MSLDLRLHMTPFVFSYKIKGIQCSLATKREGRSFEMGGFFLCTTCKEIIIYKCISCLVIGTDKSYSVKSHSNHIIQMLVILIESIFVQFSGLGFEQTFSIPMDISSASLLGDSFLNAYQVDVLQWFLKR